jgi:hypothetical protein
MKMPRRKNPRKVRRPAGTTIVNYEKTRENLSVKIVPKNANTSYLAQGQIRDPLGKINFSKSRANIRKMAPSDHRRK